MRGGVGSTVAGERVLERVCLFGFIVMPLRGSLKTKHEKDLEISHAPWASFPFVGNLLSSILETNRQIDTPYNRSDKRQISQHGFILPRVSLTQDQ
jgi:hypothetical protein